MRTPSPSINVPWPSGAGAWPGPSRHRGESPRPGGGLRRPGALCGRRAPLSTCPGHLRAGAWAGPSQHRVESQHLAGVYGAQGRYADAEPLYQRALAICERVLGPDHPNTASSLHGLAHVYNAQGRYAEAEPLYQRALAICERCLEPDHPHTASSLHRLAGSTTSRGAMRRPGPSISVPWLSASRCLAGPSRYRDESQPSGRGLQRPGALCGGRAPLSACPGHLRARLGPDHPNVALILASYVTLLRNMHRDTEAADLKIVPQQSALGTAEYMRVA